MYQDLISNNKVNINTEEDSNEKILFTIKLDDLFIYNLHKNSIQLCNNTNLTNIQSNKCLNCNNLSKLPVLIKKIARAHFLAYGKCCSTNCIIKFARKSKMLANTIYQYTETLTWEILGVCN